MKKLCKSLTALAFLLCVVITASAQTDLKGRLDSLLVPALGSNTASMSAPIGWGVDQVLVFQLTVTATNAANTNATAFAIETSNDGDNWLKDQYMIAVTNAGSGTATSISRLTNTVGGQWIRTGYCTNESAKSVIIKAFNYTSK
jgi:hypothetical protein